VDAKGLHGRKAARTIDARGVATLFVIQDLLGIDAIAARRRI